MPHPWLRSAGWIRLVLPALIVLLGVGGYILVSQVVERDRSAAAERFAQVEGVQTQQILARVRASVAGLGDVLAGEPERERSAFSALANSTAGSLGLVDALWIERGAGSRLTAVYTTGTRLRPGLDVSSLPALHAAILNRSSVLAVSATSRTTLAGDPGFYVVRAGAFGPGPGRSGYLALFVPEGWLTLALNSDPRRLAISLDGRRLEGALAAAPAASTEFEALARRWRVDVDLEPRTALQSTLPWLALAWPAAAALIALLVGRAIVRRRRAERDVERIFDLSLDLLCVAGLDGYFKRVNPAFERTLGYPTHELLSRPFVEFVHPDDRERTRSAMAALARGEEVVQFENRYVRADGSERWLQWSVTPVPEREVMYGAARDVTERKLLADEQAALRRVATLVARGVPPAEVFGAVAAEVAGLLHADTAKLQRYEADGTTTVAAEHGADVPTGAEVATPVVVEGRLWGVITAAWRQGRVTPPATEARMAQFTELVATSVANAESRAELTASRARIVAASDETRRRIERDLHDGIQQRLVSLALGLRAAEAKVPPGLDELRTDLDRAAQGLAGTVEDLQEITRGIHPAILSRGGLAPALRTLARRSPIPVELDVHADRRLPEGVEVAAYYLVSEALTNAAKHAHASTVRVAVDAEDSVLDLSVRDDGVGGADPNRGSGLIGLRDRVEALGGSIEIASGAGTGTSVHAQIPIAADA